MCWPGHNFTPSPACSLVVSLSHWHTSSVDTHVPAYTVAAVSTAHCWLGMPQVILCCGWQELGVPASNEKRSKNSVSSSNIYFHEFRVTTWFMNTEMDRGPKGVIASCFMWNRSKLIRLGLEPCCHVHLTWKLEEDIWRNFNSFSLVLKWNSLPLQQFRNYHNIVQKLSHFVTSWVLQN